MRWPMGESFAGCRFARGGHDRRQFVRFREQSGKFCFWQDTGLDRQFEPKRGLVGFFLDDSNFGDELGLAARPATGVVVGRDGSSAAENLFCDYPASIIALGNFPAHLDDTERKRLGACLQLDWVHAANVQTQSAIGHRPSAISK